MAENSIAGTNVVNPKDSTRNPVGATDFNNDTLTYSTSGSDASAFTINSSTGQLSVASGADLDYERKRSYTFTVQVTDGQDD